MTVNHADLALRAIHDAAGHAVPAIFHGGAGDVPGLRVLVEAPDAESTPFDGPGAFATARTVRVLVQDVPDIAEGDQITLNPGDATESRHTLASPHLPEAHRRRWKATLRKAEA